MIKEIVIIQFIDGADSLFIRQFVMFLLILVSPRAAEETPFETNLRQNLSKLDCDVAMKW